MLAVLVPLTAKRNQKNPDAPEEYYVMKSYIKKLTAHGLVPFFVTREMMPSAVDELYAACGGVMIVGGPDIDPALYGEPVHPKTETSDPATDAFMCVLTRRALQDKKPFLGICRGSQMLAVAAGGTLFQHIPEVTSLNHKDESIKEYSDITNAPKHDIIFSEGSRAGGIFGVDKITVNSMHHQAIKTLGPDLRVSALAPDGIVEMIEHKDPAYFCFGIQSHPEAEVKSFGEALFAEFAQAVKHYTSNTTSYAHVRN